MRVLHITPTYFSTESILGGAERFVDELSKSMSKMTDTTVLSFGTKSYITNTTPQLIVKKPIVNYKDNIINPLSFNIYNEIRNHDIIHCHQIFTLISEISIFYALLFRKKIFLTDHGGGGRTFLMNRGLTHLSNGLFCVSDYNLGRISHLHKNKITIFGGVNTDLFAQALGQTINAEQIITIGRILPHKGHHHLIKALKEDWKLIIIGRVADQEYLEHLKYLAKNKNVEFYHDLTDADLIEFLNSSNIAVYPSTFIGPNQELLQGEPELFGLAPLEAMSCNIPTLVSDIGSYPEISFSKDFLFQDGNIDDLQSKIEYAFSTTNRDNFRQHVLQKFTWDHCAKRCLGGYKR